MSRRALLAIAGLLISGTATAQYTIGGVYYACPAGLPWNDPRCIRQPVGQQAVEPMAPAAPAGKWVDVWGAIASDTSRGMVGTASGQWSKRDAEAAARFDCTSAGGADCKVLLSYVNQCVAFAAPHAEGHAVPGVASAFAARSAEEASARAQRKCESDNGKSCQTMFTECVRPIFLETGY